MILVPGFTTHYLFGVKAYNDLPNNYLKHVISKYRWLYQLGLQGPDIFFYNVPILRHRDYRNVGSHMHEYQVNDFFKNSLLELTEIHSRQQKEEAAAFLAGFMCHYISDSICHPFVYGRIKYRTDKKKTECHGLHAALENDIDAILLWKFKHKKPSEFNQTASLCLNAQESQFISRYLSRCINRTYYQITEKNNFQVTDGMVARSIFAIRFGSRILSDPAGHKTHVIGSLESIFLKHPIASKKLVTDKLSAQVRDILNLDHEVWTNPGIKFHRLDDVIPGSVPSDLEEMQCSLLLPQCVPDRECLIRARRICPRCWRSSETIPTTAGLMWDDLHHLMPDTDPGRLRFPGHTA